MTRKIAFLGTGLMGAPMVRRLLGAGFDLTVWNRDLAKAEGLRADGAKVAATAVDAVKDAEIVFTMLSDGSYQSPITRRTLARLAANTARTLDTYTGNAGR